MKRPVIYHPVIYQLSGRESASEPERRKIVDCSPPAPLDHVDVVLHRRADCATVMVVCRSPRRRVVVVDILP